MLELDVNTDELEEFADTFKLLADKSRLTIIALLKHRDLCVCELVDLTGLTQPNVSQHMRKLKAGQLVTEQRRGQWIHYSLNIPNTHPLRCIVDRLPSLEGKFQALTMKNVIC